MSKKARQVKTPFAFRVKLGNFEVEISGTREETLKTISDLPSLMGKITKAFETVPSKTSQSIKKADSQKQSIPYPKISKSKSCSDMVQKLLNSEWGRWRPRTIRELLEAMKVNAMHYPSSTLSGVLTWLVKRGKLRRWKTDEGYVYIISEQD